MCADEVYPVDSSGGGVGYYGWTNWDTWDANLWLTNDESTYNEVVRALDAEGVSRVFTEWFQSDSGSYVDDIDPEKVNWQEIFDSLHEGE